MSDGKAWHEARAQLDYWLQAYAKTSVQLDYHSEEYGDDSAFAKFLAVQVEGLRKRIEAGKQRLAELGDPDY